MSIQEELIEVAKDLDHDSVEPDERTRHFKQI